MFAVIRMAFCNKNSDRFKTIDEAVCVLNGQRIEKRLTEQKRHKKIQFISWKLSLFCP